ncbi:TPA: ATP-binding cassette domain-containing protein, partial [Staphylococcus aureus]|nr:ATP-binding cassette domain-containing protein [Staphylococcus aureus]
MLTIQDVSKSYRDKGTRQYREVVKGVSFTCEKGESISIIGESGSGKSTLGRMILGIEKPDRGRVDINGQCVCRREVRRGQMSAVFQNYKSSLHPYFNVEQILKEPLQQLKLSKADMHQEMIRLLEEVGLDKSFL